MKSIPRNILAVVVGFVVGSIVNMAIVVAGGSLIPPPEGVDMETAEGMRAAMSTLEPKHFLMPFLAHALGTLVGGGLAALISASHKMVCGMVIGGLFLALGVMMILMVGGPLWFIACDLILAYLPMAWIGGSAAKKMTTAKPDKERTSS